MWLRPLVGDGRFSQGVALGWVVAGPLALKASSFAKCMTGSGKGTGGCLRSIVCASAGVRRRFALAAQGLEAAGTSETQELLQRDGECGKLAEHVTIFSDETNLMLLGQRDEFAVVRGATGCGD